MCASRHRCIFSIFMFRRFLYYWMDQKVNPILLLGVNSIILLYFSTTYFMVGMLAKRGWVIIVYCKPSVKTDRPPVYKSWLLFEKMSSPLVDQLFSRKSLQHFPGTPLFLLSGFQSEFEFYLCLFYRCRGGFKCDTIHEILNHWAYFKALYLCVIRTMSNLTIKLCWHTF